MKRYELLNLEFTNKKDFKKTMDFCPKDTGAKINCVEECSTCVTEYLFQDVTTKKVIRWEVYKGDFEKARKDFFEQSKPKMHANECNACIHRFVEWLMQEVEILEEF